MTVLHPYNIRRSLPPAGGGMPDLILAALQAGATKPATITEALQVLGVTDNIADALPTANHPVNILDALPSTAVPGVVTMDSTFPFANGWGVIDGIGGDNSNLAVQTNDGDATIIQSSDTTTNVGIEMSFALIGLRPSYVGWSFNFVARKTNAISPVIGVQITPWTNRTFSGGAFSGGNITGEAPVTDAGWLSGLVNLDTNVYAIYSAPMSAATALAFATPPTAGKYHTIALNTLAGGTPTVVMNITQIYINIP